VSVKSILDIEVNDAQFTRFAASFAKYQDELSKAPTAWAATTKEAGLSTAQFDRLTAALLAQREVTRQIRADQIAISHAAAAQSKVWADFKSQWHGIAGYVTTATRSLLRWGSIGTGIAGALAVGTIFGLDRLAISAGNQRRSALGLGLTPGEQRSFSANFGRLSDPNQFLGSVNEALHDATKRVGLYGAGLGDSDLRGKDTGEVASLLVPALKRLADQTPEAMMAQVLRARHLDQFITLEDFERYKHTPAAEISGYQQQYQKNRTDLELTRQQQKAWQDLQVQLHFAGMSIETTFIRGLAPLAPQLRTLSEDFRKFIGGLLKSGAVSHWIDEFGHGLEWLGKTISTPKFEKDVTDFMARIGVMADKVGTVVDALYRAVVWLNKWIPDSSNDPILKWGDPSLGLPPAPGWNNGRLPPGTNPGAPNGVPRTGPIFGPQHTSFTGSFGSPAMSGLRTQEAHDFFRAAGWTEAQTAGLLSNIQYESGFNPRSINPTGHQGLAQWDRARSALFRQIFGHDPAQGTFEEQLMFIQYELTHNEKAAGDRLRAARGAGQSGAVVNEYYERSGTDSGGRARTAEQYAGQFKDRSVTVKIQNNTGGNANVSFSQLATTSA
jgi:hypothetical protein